VSSSSPASAHPSRSLLLAAVVVGVLLTLLCVAGPAGAVIGRDGPDPVGVWPLDPEPEVVRTFDPPDNPFGAGHRGVDLAGRVGQPVRSALPGTVTFAGSLAGRGVVVVSHGATRTTYEPVRAAVAKGDVVGAGGALGVLQASSSHCFPSACLHWGWIEGETYLDPLRLVGGGPVRLLPLWAGSPAAALAAALPGQALGWAWR